MFDTININLKMTPAWQDHVTHGDIVSFHFPFAEDISIGQPKARPCLILDIELIGGQRYALIAYGTTSHRRSNVGHEVHVRRRAEYLSAGLDKPTRFVGARRVLVPLTHSGFAICSATGSAVLGRLNGEPFEAMNAVRGRIHAMRDIAAEARPRRRRSHLRRRDFKVERREPRKVAAVVKAVQG